MRYPKLLLALLAALAIFGFGCDSSSTAPDPGEADVATLKSDLPRDDQPEVSADDLAALVAGNHELTCDLYAELRAEEDGNLLFSPTSIRIAFAMAHAGAKGETADQIARILKFGLTGEAVWPAFNALDQALLSRNIPAGDDEDAVEFQPANSFWGLKDYPFKDTYLDVLATHFGAGLRTADFVNAPDPSRIAINDWVAEKTRDRILDLLPPSSIDPMTVAVLVNALFMKAPWAEKFDSDRTSDGDFDLLPAGTVTVPMMHGTVPGHYAEGDGWTAAELPLRGQELALVVIMPDEGSFTVFENDLDGSVLTAILAALSPSDLMMTLPKFSYTMEFQLKKILRKLGMTDPFLPAIADFTGIADDMLYIDDAYHKAFIGVDEKGVEAAAATAVVIERTSFDVQEFTVDRPFLIGIHDRPTGALIFFGRVLDPSS